MLSRCNTKDQNILYLLSINAMKTGGGERIRTSDRLAPITVFETAAFDHSATPPHVTTTLPQQGQSGRVFLITHAPLG